MATRLRGVDGGKKIKSKQRSSVSLHPGDATDHTSTAMVVPAQDAQGKTEKVILRVPPAVVRMIDIIKNKPGLGFKTHTDVSRAALYEGIKVLSSIIADPSLSNLQSLLDSWVNTCRTEEEYINYTHTIGVITETVNKLVAANATEKAQTIVRNLYLELKNMDDKFWKKRYEEIIRERFGYLVDTRTGRNKKRRK